MYTIIGFECLLWMRNAKCVVSPVYQQKSNKYTAYHVMSFSYCSWLSALCPAIVHNFFFIFHTWFPPFDWISIINFATNRIGSVHTAIDALERKRLRSIHIICTGNSYMIWRCHMPKELLLFFTLHFICLVCMIYAHKYHGLHNKSTRIFSPKIHQHTFVIVNQIC